MFIFLYHYDRSKSGKGTSGQLHMYLGRKFVENAKING